MDYGGKNFSVLNMKVATFLLEFYNSSCPLRAIKSMKDVKLFHSFTSEMLLFCLALLAVKSVYLNNKNKYIEINTLLV